MKKESFSAVTHVLAPVLQFSPFEFLCYLVTERMLGVRVSQEGPFADKLKHHQLQALKWICNINSAPLSQEDTYTTYCSLWCPTFKSPLPVT